MSEVTIVTHEGIRWYSLSLVAHITISGYFFHLHNCLYYLQDVPDAKKMKTSVVTTTTANGSPDPSVGEQLTSKDYYFDSYSHFGTYATPVVHERRKKGRRSKIKQTTRQSNTGHLTCGS